MRCAYSCNVFGVGCNTLRSVRSAVLLSTYNVLV